MMRSLACGVLLLSLPMVPPARTTRPARPAPPPLRLYVLDCGTTDHVDPTRFGLPTVAVPRLADPCFLIVHPKGTLLWDAGAYPDSAWTPDGTPQAKRVTLPGGAGRDVTVRDRLSAQLERVGVPPERITYVGLSHAHWDHTANLYQFPHATWILRRAELDAMTATPPLPLSQPSDWAALPGVRRVALGAEDYDVFGDGRVILKFAPGHTPGHQVLYVRLARTGGVLLAGDLYHFPEQVAAGTVPAFDYDTAATRASRADVAAWLKARGGVMWIQHDFVGNALLRKAPAYYE